MNDLATQKACPQCMSVVHVDVARCPDCTSWMTRPRTSMWWFWLAMIAAFVVFFAARDQLSLPVNIVEVGPEF